MSDLADIYLQRMHRVIRVANGEAIKEAAKLEKIHNKILAAITREYGSVSSVNLDLLNAQIEEILFSHYRKEVIPTQKELVNEVVAKEIIWNQNSIVKIGIGVAKVKNADTVITKALNTPYQGHKFSTWFKGLGKTNVKKINGIIKNGYVNGLTTPQVVSEVQAVMNLHSRDIKTLVRSSLQHAAHIAREEVIENNKDIIDGKEWVSTLDLRTTAICGARDGLHYDLNNKPVGHDLPWLEGPGSIHFNCRSTFIPTMSDPKLRKLFEPGDRPAVSAGRNYERGDNVTRLGTVRKPNKAAREDGIFKVERVSGKITYEDWLKVQPKDFIADALGSDDKATAFLSGELSIKDISQSKPLTVKSL